MNNPTLEATLFNEERVMYSILCAVNRYKNESSAYKFQVEDRIGHDIDQEVFHKLCDRGYLTRIDTHYYLTDKGKAFIINSEWKYN